MNVLTPGHRYELKHHESEGHETIQFIEKFLADGPEVPGTTNEEVLACLIDRMNYLNTAFPCRENALAITKLEEALMWLNKRTQNRIERGVEGKNEV